MNYQDDFRDSRLVAIMAENIAGMAAQLPGPVSFMEVCGTHTMSIYQYGIRSLLPDNVRLISGPGCPVCVTPIGYVDKAVACASDSNNIVATFGDMLRVPGSRSSLMEARAQGADVRVVYSPWMRLPWPRPISTDGSSFWESDSKQQHRPSLPAFWMRPGRDYPIIAYWLPTKPFRCRWNCSPAIRSWDFPVTFVPPMSVP